MISNSCVAQSQELQQLILNVEKLAQFKKILSDMKAGYEILVKGYNAVRDISQGNFDLHKVFLDGLLEVSPAVRKYYKVGKIIKMQIVLVDEYKQAFKQFKASELFDPDQINYLERIYQQLLNESWQSLDQLAMVMTSGQLRMNDDERLQQIDNIHTEMQERLNFLRSFNSKTSLLLFQKTKEINDVNKLKALYK